MAFGQQAGPPAGQRQIEELADLLRERGFDSFREARHPFQLTQRQASGKFTIDEANAFRDRLEAAAAVASSSEPTQDADATRVSGGVVPMSAAARSKAEQRRRESETHQVATMDAEVLADELSRRGWCCIPPE